MLNILWVAFIFIGMVYGTVNGQIGEVSDAILESGEKAVSLCISMLGILCIWSGIMEIAKKGGLIAQLTRLMSPLVRFLFPDIPKNHPVTDNISLNIIANILGLGWASTPSGLAAMRDLAELNDYSARASDAMCNFLILNISSLQLIPITVISYRSSYGAASPSDIVFPAILATFASTLAGVLFIKLVSCRRWGHRLHAHEHS